jgi:hypothetical protein
VNNESLTVKGRWGVGGKARAVEKRDGLRPTIHDLRKEHTALKLFVAKNAFEFQESVRAGGGRVPDI